MNCRGKRWGRITDLFLQDLEFFLVPFGEPLQYGQ